MKRGQKPDRSKENVKKACVEDKDQSSTSTIKTENVKAPTCKCSCCDNQPAYYCSTCQLYLCGAQCIKQHKIVPATRDHQLYTLDIKEQDGSSDKIPKCLAHCNAPIEFYCSTCKKSACKQCEYILDCYQQQHNVILMSTAIDEFNKDATEVVKLARTIENELTEKLKLIAKDRSFFDSQLNLCRTAIENQEKKLIKKVHEKSRELKSNFEEIHKNNKEYIASKVESMKAELTQVNHLVASISTLMNRPEERETLTSHTTIINTLRDEVLGTTFGQSFHSISFHPSTHLDELMSAEGIGEITTLDSMKFKVSEDYEAITVAKGESFVVEVISPAEIDACQLAATLINSSGKESVTEIEYQESGEYKIRGRCNVEGDWQMMITAGAAHIKGSPVNIKVETQGLVHTIDNISDYKKHNKTEKVIDVVLDRDGCILVSSFSRDILKFNLSGSLIAKQSLQYCSRDAVVAAMHQLADGHMLYSAYYPYSRKRLVLMYDDTGKHKQSFHEKLLYPFGLAVNTKSRVMYVADCEAHCVFKFNVEDGNLLGRIGVGQLKEPQDVTLTKEGHVIVADYGNNRIQMFDAYGKFMRVCIIGCGEEDGKVMGPHSVTMDMDENLIVSSNHKLQLFDKNGVFIKRIDHKDDGLYIPLGCAVTSDRPRRVAVANHGKNNVKIFKY
ncbi:E3 ubiquitin-protein ligase TRIM71-like [Anneissia japonica]|uniref:E3 ubiquitin-protein ligase TRIM71-like n=1 Tax=Anneissia japonica TaxID=1529436 RepID=UPI001425A571|nr:E3 ubiquitin-protein ligase TRIM71-like [Anneissia japonica]